MVRGEAAIRGDSGFLRAPSLALQGGSFQPVCPSACLSIHLSVWSIPAQVLSSCDLAAERKCHSGRDS